jgi:hypothetical protein
MDILADSKDNCLFKNNNNFEPNQKDEEDLLLHKEIFNEIDQNLNKKSFNEKSQNLTKENAEENCSKCQYFLNETYRKVSTQYTEKTVHLERTKIFKTENKDEKKIDLNIKRLRKLLAQCKDKGYKVNQILNRIKNNILFIILTIVFEMFKKTDFYKIYKIILQKIDKSSYSFENSSKNLLFLQKQLKEVLSEKKENEQIIKIIMSNNDYPPLINLLNMTIKELITLFSDEYASSKLEEEYFLYLKDSYKELKAKLKKEGKSDVYIESFNYFAGHIEYVYKSIYEHRKNKCKELRIW